jgi:DNA-binding MarR family transcriptional regulator
MEDEPIPADPAPGTVERLNEAMRAWYVSFSELGRQFGLHLGMHSSDAAALVHIATAEDGGTPLTQSQLARRLGLTTPATSSLLNRLEDAGYVERHRNRTDRRVVTLRSTPGVHEEIDTFFRSVGQEVDQLIATRPDDQIAAFTRLLVDMTGVLNHHLDEKTTPQR